MTGKLSPRMLDVLRAIGAGEPKPKATIGTLKALWSRGLIASISGYHVHTMRGYKAAGRDHELAQGWKLTPEGKLALSRGRQMITRRREP